MKKPLLVLAFVGFLIWLYFQLKIPDSNPLYVSGQRQILLTTPEKGEADADIVSAIAAINRRNSQIRTFVCNDVDIRYSEKVRVRISGTMVMEKEKKFRMKIRSVVGLEMDLGSNDTHFWFWSKRMDSPYLHYARHEDLGKSMLKTPLNPGWLMAALNLGLLDTSGCRLIKHKQFFAIVSAKKGAGDEPITVLTLISPEKKAVVGHYLYDQNGKMTASTEVRSFQQSGGFTVPHEMLIIWYEEGVQFEWTLNSPKVNSGIDPQNWSMPEMKNSIDMGR